MAGRSWPNVSQAMRDEIGAIIDVAAKETTRSFDRFPHEDRLTGEFFGLIAAFEKVRTRGGSTATFRYWTFDGTTEREVGADGAIILSVRHQGQTRKKVLLFQAKRLPGQASRTRLTIPPGRERTRLARQLRDLAEVAGSGGALGLFYTRQGIYAVDAVRLLRLAEEDDRLLRNPLIRRSLPVLISDCVADLALACRIGSRSPTLVRELERDGLKAYAERRFSLRHRLEVRVRVPSPADLEEKQVASDRVEQEDETASDDTAQEEVPTERVEPKALPAPSKAFEDYFREPPRKREPVPSVLELLKNLFRR